MVISIHTPEHKTLDRDPLAQFCGGDIAAHITSACVLELLAPKVGNVHPHASFDDLSAGDFFVAAIAIAQPLSRASELGIGRTILQAVQKMQQIARTNTHLGIILLLAPLAAAESIEPASVHQQLEELGPADASYVFQAILAARPGGLGTSDHHDVHSQPPSCLLEAMKSAADRDLIAKQYSHGFADIFDVVVPGLTRPEPMTLLERIVRTHIELIARFGDSLILRKCGKATMMEAQRRAQLVQMAWNHGATGEQQRSELDAWLRADGHRRNPGATADLIAAGLFVALRTGTLVS